MLYRDESDETLVMMTLAGEEKAYEALVVRYQKGVIAAAAAVTHSHFMAEDAAQDAFTVAWMKLDTLREPRCFGAWVSGIARNCARSTLRRYHELLPLDELVGCREADTDANPAELYVLREQRDELLAGVEGLPPRVREVVRLHYFEELSVAEIAERMSISVGTVKWQLHDGRKRLRKELSAMNEKPDDTLTVRVMKKVEEIKLWDSKKNKDGFAAVYSELLHDIDALPETDQKYHALADVLLRGWWWLPGKGGDDTLTRVKEAALHGKNEEVMEFVVTREDRKIKDTTRREEHIKNVQLPFLRENGFVKALGREYYSLGELYIEQGRADEGAAALDEARALLGPEHRFYHLADILPQVLGRVAAANEQKLPEYRYAIWGNVWKLSRRGGRLLVNSGSVVCGEGYLHLLELDTVLEVAAACDGVLTDAGLAVGESITGSDGSTLTYSADDETVTVPAGRFEHCRLWTTLSRNEYSKHTCRMYLCEGVGIVKLEVIRAGVRMALLLKDYSARGDGALPTTVGNRWSYTLDRPTEAVGFETTLEIVGDVNNGEQLLVRSLCDARRYSYDESRWDEMAVAIAQEYFPDDDHTAHDVSHYIERAEALAATECEREHTRAAASVARRIMAGDKKLTPNATISGHWNFFEREAVCRVGDEYRLTDYDPTTSFELKCITGDSACQALLFSDVLGILDDAARCVWSDGWRVGAEPTVELTAYGNVLKTRISCTASEPITTAAGRFEDCIKLSLDTTGLEQTRGIEYRGGHKEYYFARGVGIVRTVSEYADGLCRAVYELTSYSGAEGDEYLPLCEGLRLRYDAVGLTDGYRAWVDYSFVRDENGELIYIGDRAGIRDKLQSVTDYSSVRDEAIEDQLWDEGRRDESRARHDVNNFRLLVHFMSRDARCHAKPARGVDWDKYCIGIVDSFRDENGKLPDGWLGRYWWLHFHTAVVLFGTKQHKEEGYEYLERAFELYEEWAKIPDGAVLEIGRPEIYGGVKIVKGKSCIELADGSREPMPGAELFFNRTVSNAYYGMTAKRGWEWFNSVRGEERFNEYIERARRLCGEE